jgi:GDPmannose 4,6-dehydratase
MNSKEIPFLLGNPYKAKRNLGWTPKTSLSEVAKMMYDNDYKMILENEYEMQK